MAKHLTDLVAELDDEAFERLYGPLARLRPAEAAELLAGLTAPWWIVGGLAIEAFTCQPRDHEDLDVSVLASDVPTMIGHLLTTHHLWAAGGGMMAPVPRP